MSKDLKNSVKAFFIGLKASIPRFGTDVNSTTGDSEKEQFLAIRALPISSSKSTAVAGDVDLANEVLFKTLLLLLLLDVIVSVGVELVVVVAVGETSVVFS